MTLSVLVTGLMASMTPAAMAEGGYPPGPSPPVVSQTLPPAPPPADVQSTVAFTGADILRWAAMALILLVAGSLLVIAARRRHRVAGTA